MLTELTSSIATRQAQRKTFMVQIAAAGAAPKPPSPRSVPPGPLLAPPGCERSAGWGAGLAGPLRISAKRQIGQERFCLKGFGLKFKPNPA